MVDRQTVRHFLERSSKPALQPVALDRSAELARDREAKPGALVPRILAREVIEDEKARRRRPAVPVDGVEIARAREPVTPFHHLRAQAERRLRPFARRRLRTARPALVDMRARNPCRRFRLRTFG